MPRWYDPGIIADGGHMRKTLFTALIVVAASTLAGCMDLVDDLTDDTGDNDAEPTGAYVAMGFNGTHWPSLNGTTLTILDHGAFAAFDDAASLFENLTGAKVVHIEADDTGSALNTAIQQKGDPEFDVLYGIDNAYYTRAVEADVLQPYKPLLAGNISPEYVFFDADGPWYATPVDHGYIGLNVDHDHDALAGATIANLSDVRDHADAFVTQDPRTSTPGAGFLLATIATYGEDGDHTWKDYWTDLFEGGVLITSGWTEAYENHFSAGYGVHYGGQADKPIVTSYTESPAYEHYFGRAEEDLAHVVLAPNSTFHQVQTMAVAKGTGNQAVAEAWIEFTLTDAFQTLAAPQNAVYPVTTTAAANQSVADTYGGVDPAPGTFEPAALDHATIGANLETWISEWVTLCEAHDCI